MKLVLILTRLQNYNSVSLDCVAMLKFLNSFQNLTSCIYCSHFLTLLFQQTLMIPREFWYSNYSYFSYFARNSLANCNKRKTDIFLFHPMRIYLSYSLRCQSLVLSDNSNVNNRRCFHTLNWKHQVVISLPNWIFLIKENTQHDKRIIKNKLLNFRWTFDYGKNGKWINVLRRVVLKHKLIFEKVFHLSVDLQ